MWLFFYFADWSNGQRTQELFDPWRVRGDGLFFCEEKKLLIPVPIPAGEAKEEVVRSVQSYLKTISDTLTTGSEKP